MADTRVRRVLAVTSVGRALSVASDIAERPVQRRGQGERSAIEGVMSRGGGRESWAVADGGALQAC